MPDDSLLTALAATAVFRTPAKIRDGILDGEALARALADLGPVAVEELRRQAAGLADRGVGAVLPRPAGDLPGSLTVRGVPVVPFLYYRGDRAVLGRPALAISGSRDASEEALRASGAVGKLAADLGFALVAGNARGVDSAAANGAWAAGGDVISVLPEGITRSAATPPGDGAGEFLAVSQFVPDARWSAFNAMARNKTICALGVATVVAAAGEKGGSIDAGRKALSLGRPLFVLTYRDATPPGNALLIDEGGHPIDSIDRLRGELRALTDEPEQLPLL